ncbi:uL15 family ribosomal protein [Candidatus Micrarchaeota archaeon]|nr:uL15 family ribosomal protein [Candidatus Micrarchaeota archaeon]
MARRHRKASRKYLGSRSWGAGNIKNRRGKGSKGGKGYGGGQTTKWSWIVRYEPDHFGRHGFTRPNKKLVKTINLFELNILVEKGKIEKTDGKYNFSFDGKILGTGTIKYPLKIKAASFSKKAKERIEQAGGEILTG